MATARLPIVSAIGLSVLLFTALTVFYCERPQTGDEASAAPKAIPVVEESSARTFSDSVVADLLNDNREALIAKMETSAREYYTIDKFNNLMENVFHEYGKPLNVEYKKNMVGYKANLWGSVRPMRKFWYAVETTKFKTGTHFVFVEVVEEEKQLASSGFAIVHFPVGIPGDMR